MALSRSLSIGASGLIAQQSNFDVISNNIANSTTVGFKGSQATFQEEINLLKKSGQSPDEPNGNGSIGGINPVQYGLGVKIGSIKQDFSQGPIETTNNPLDIALDGEGFLIYNMNGQELYSRAGNLDIDKDGYIVDTATGAYLQGYNLMYQNGQVVQSSSDEYTIGGVKSNLVIDPNIQSAPKQTENLTLSGNLNAENEEGDVKSTSITIYDRVGNTHELTITFTKAPEGVDLGNGLTTYYASTQIDGIDIPSNGLDTKPVTFNADGLLNEPDSIYLTVEDMNAVLGTDSFEDLNYGDNSDITINLGDPNDALTGITSFSGSNTASFQNQDGYKTGALNTLNVNADGMIKGTFTNGRSEILGQMLISRFTNQEGLTREGNNFYAEAPNSGTPIIGTANEVFPTTSIISYALEQSNVDLTKEFTEMISAQRAYEAAARIVTTSDTLLGETTMLKR